MLVLALLKGDFATDSIRDSSRAGKRNASPARKTTVSANNTSACRPAFLMARKISPSSPGLADLLDFHITTVGRSLPLAPLEKDSLILRPISFLSFSAAHWLRGGGGGKKICPPYS